MNARKIKLIEILIEQFKGIKRYHAHFDGHNATISAANGVGKTTVYDAFLWALFGKDSSGRKDFEVRPLDGDNEPVRDLVTKVEAVISIDGINHTLRKEQHEKIIKEQLKGYETLCWVDDVPKKVGEFQDFVNDIIPEETFKMLTDLSHFNSKLHWTARREVLIALAGETGTPAGFEELLARCNGRKIKDYENVLKEQKKRCVKERDDIGPRIDEINRGLAIPDKSVTDLQADRELIQGTSANTEEKRQQLLAEESKRQEAIDKVNHLTCERLHRETQFKNQVPTELIAEKTKLESEHGERTQGLVAVSNKVNAARNNMAISEGEIENLLKKLDGIRKEKEQIESAKSPTECFNCKQTLPKDMLAEEKTRRDTQIAETKKRAKAALDLLDKEQAKLADLKTHVEELLQKQNDLRGELMAAESAKNARIAEIDEAIKSQKGADPSTDEQWQQLTAKIEEAQKAIGKPAREQLETLEAQAKIVRAKLAELDKALAQADRAEQDKARIAELGEREKTLAQQIADVDKQLAEIDEYKKTESKMIEAAVNGRFKYVEFKLFKYLLNGNIEPCCEAVYNGVPFADLSTGQQILVGVDIVNVLSEHYGVSAPLFVDHSESITLPIEAHAQTIRLMAVQGVNELVIGVETPMDEVSWQKRKGA